MNQNTTIRLFLNNFAAKTIKKEPLLSSDTICALATPPGIGAIAVIRLSGKNAIEICNACFTNKDLTKVDGHTLHFGTLRDDERIVDEVLVSVFKAPHSYTGENAVEISVHGSPYIQQKVMQLLIKNGARSAGPGEFTLRAFLNKKLDLSQAEAVADVIAANSEASHQLAMQQMRGGFSNEIENLRDELIHFASLIELELDFGEEDVEFANRTDLKELVEKLNAKLHQLITSFDYGNVIKTGVPVAIVGEPNVGKSTLLNALLKEDRAIVSDIPGTTRDAIEDEVVLNGVNFRFVDTAGIRDTSDAIESIGIEKTYEKIEQAAIVLLLLDGTNISREQVEESMKAIKNRVEGKEKKVMVIVNKVDKLTKEEVEPHLEEVRDVIYVSAKTDKNMEAVKGKLFDFVMEGRLQSTDTVVTNARHYEALTNANASLVKVMDGLDNNVTGDFLAMDIRQALHYLSLITGTISTDDLLDNIFSRFCIGK